METKIKAASVKVMLSVEWLDESSLPEQRWVDKYPVMIKCPECDTVQAAFVEKTIPFGTFIHDCVNCKYTIMESEWEEVKPFPFHQTIPMSQV